LAQNQLQENGAATFLHDIKKKLSSPVHGLHQQALSNSFTVPVLLHRRKKPNVEMISHEIYRLDIAPQPLQTCKSTTQLHIFAEKLRTVFI